MERIEGMLGWVGSTYQSAPMRVKPEELARMFDELSNRLTDALKGVYLLGLSDQEAEFYESRSPFGAEVDAKFSPRGYCRGR